MGDDEERAILYGITAAFAFLSVAAFSSGGKTAGLVCGGLAILCAAINFVLEWSRP